MKTAKRTTEKDERAAWIQRRRENHHRALESLATNGIPGLKLWRKLRRIENRANGFAVAYCNGNIDSDDWELYQEEFTQSVKEAFGELPKGFFEQQIVSELIRAAEELREEAISAGLVYTRSEIDIALRDAKELVND